MPRMKLVLSLINLSNHVSVQNTCFQCQEFDLLVCEARFVKNPNVLITMSSQVIYKVWQLILV